MKTKKVIVILASIFILLISIWLFFLINFFGMTSESSATAYKKPIEQEEPAVSPPPTATPAPSPAATPKLPETYNVKLTAVGDIMLHSYQLDNAYDKANGTYNFDHSFENISKYLTGSDITLGNLETVFGGKESGYTDFPMFNAPDEFAQAIKKAGFNLLTTANNHSNDRREAGVLRTIETLDALGIEHFGTYSSNESRDNIFIKEINNIKFAFLSYTYGTNGILVPEGKDYLINIISEDLIKEDIKKAKTLSPDFIIVTPHMGNEYELAPRQVFKDWAYLMLEYGADIVLASHPHVLQPVEYVTVTDKDGQTRDCFIAYSLANFISSQRTIPRDAGIIFNINFEKTEGREAVIKEISYIPTWVKFVDAKGRYDISVFSLYDILKPYQNGKSIDFRPKDINRLQTIHADDAKMFLQKEIPPEEIQNEYILEKTEHNSVSLNFNEQ